MTLVMAKYHFNIYPIPVHKFSYSLDILKDFYREIDSRFPYFVGDAPNRKELKFLLGSLPENVTYMVFKNNSFSVWMLPTPFSTIGIDHLISNCCIDTSIASRDVGFFELKRVLDDLPYNYHFIVQRYYD